MVSIFSPSFNLSLNLFSIIKEVYPIAAAVSLKAGSITIFSLGISNNSFSISLA